MSSFVLTNPDTPTFCMGDLNNIMHVNEKSGPNPANAARIRNFCCLVKDCGFFNLGFNGTAYTWTNKRFTTNPTFQRFDRCLANAEWCMAFPATAIFHLPMIYSDHAAILAVLHSNTSRKPKRQFRFENWWLLEPDYNKTANESWIKSHGIPFHKRTNHLAKDLKVWSKKKKPINQQLATIEISILQQQNLPPQHQNQTTLATLYHNHQQLLTKDAEYHCQRIKKLWATDGDRNTQFFQHAILK